MIRFAPFGSTAACFLFTFLHAPALRGQESPLDVGLRYYWNGDYGAAVAALDGECDGLAQIGERVDCFSYLAFSQIALGREEPPRRAFVELLSIDPGYRLDPDLVSPKIIARFEDASRQLVDAWFDEAKAGYAREDYDAALKALDRLLQLDESHELAREYRQLCQEREALKEKLAQAPPEPVEPTELASVPEEPRVYRIDSGIERPVLIHRVDPVYPRAARARRIEGSVVVAVVIDAAGSVRDLDVVRSASDSLDEAALQAVAQWRYRPATRNGVPVAVHSLVQLRFELES